MTRHYRALMLIVISTLWVACDSTQSSADPVSSPTQDAEFVATEEATTPPTEEPTTVPETDVPPTSTEVPAPWPPEPVDPWPAEAQAPWPTEEWSRSTPEEQGIDSQILVEFLQVLQDEEIDYHSVLLVRNGYLVLEDYQPPYNASELHPIFSVTKTVTSILVGIAIKEGYIEGANQPVVDLFPDLTFDNMNDDKAAMTLEDVLTMSGGLRWSGVQPQDILDSPVEYPPGERFTYGNEQPRLLLAAVTHATGIPARDFAQSGLFDPLGISREDTRWDSLAGGVPDGAIGISLAPQAMAKLGYLYLNDGMWNDSSIVTAEWVEQSTYPHVQPSDESSEGSYGYFWWINRQRGDYAAVGYGAQLIIVMPKVNMVLVTTAGARSPNRDLSNAVDDFIVSLEVAAEPLPANPEALAALEALIED